MWVTNAASGAEHGLSFRIFGETGGLEWHQEEPNRLVHCKRDGFDETVTRRKDSFVSEAARQVTRVEIGHPEGYLEAFANLYSDLARAVVARMRHEPSDQIDRPYPSGRRRQGSGFCRSRYPKFSLAKLASRRNAVNLIGQEEFRSCRRKERMGGEAVSLKLLLALYRDRFLEVE